MSRIAEEAMSPDTTQLMRPTLLYCVASPLSASKLLRGQLGYCATNGWDVHVACSPGVALSDLDAHKGITIHEIPIAREIAVVQDIRSLIALIGLMRSLRPDVVNAGTPKAGLLGLLAARIANVSARIYVMRGLRLETTRGHMRGILTLAEMLACRCAHTVICVSESLRQEVIALRLAPAQKTRVIGKGSSNGVDASHFKSNAELNAEVLSLRDKLNLPESRPVIGFVGRLTKDKGVVELARAFDHLYAEDNSRRLLIVGDVEEGDCLPDHTMNTLSSHPGIVRTGFVADPRAYYHLMNVLCLPTHREGFPNVVLEAACAGVPTVTTNATGAVDSVTDGVTGFIVQSGDWTALTAALRNMLSNARQTCQMGAAACLRAEREFVPQKIWRGLEAIYLETLSDNASIALSITDFNRHQ